MATITSLPAASTIDPVNDFIAIDTASVTTTQKITRNTYLGLASAPVGLTDSQTLTNKILTSPTLNTPTVSSPTLSGTLSGTYTIGGTPTFPSSVVTLTGSQTLTNKVLTAPTITNATISADTVTGFTTSTNGTIYGISVTGGTIGSAAYAAGSIGTAAIQNASITPAKLATGATSALVATSEGTTSTAYTDLATTTDSVTVTIGANGLALVVLTADCSSSTTNYAICSFAASGTNTIAASDNQAVYIATNVTVENQGSWVKVFTGLTPGSTTFKMKYRAVAGTATFKNRSISVVPL